MIADRSTHRQTDALITILCSPIGSGVINCPVNSQLSAEVEAVARCRLTSVCMRQPIRDEMKMRTRITASLHSIVVITTSQLPMLLLLLLLQRAVQADNEVQATPGRSLHNTSIR